MPRGCRKRRSRICLPCSTALARRRGSSAARCAMRCSAEPVGEIDIATTALPPEVIRRAEAAGFKAVPTGIEHGTVTVVAHGRPFEVTTLREDVETFGRHAKVAFGRDWKRDAERRDFTMNALSARATARSTIMSAGSPTSRRDACASSAMRHAHRRRLSPHPAFLSLSCRLWRGRARPGRACRLHRRARRPRAVVA